jgi:hypothetical protein
MALIVDELRAPALAHVSAVQWNTVQAIVRHRCEIVQPAPDAALVHSLFRTLRAEDPALRLTTLDVAASDDSDSDDYSGVLSALWRMLLAPSAAAAALPPRDTEVVVRSGVECVTRLLPSERANRAECQRAHGGLPPVTLPLHYAPARCVLGSARVGSLDALRAKRGATLRAVLAKYPSLRNPRPIHWARVHARGLLVRRAQSPSSA